MQDESQTPASDTQALLDFVAQREVPCPVCSYNLRGLTRPSCPECGNELKLRVGAESPINKAWLTMLIAMALPAGLGVLISIIFIVGFAHISMNDLSYLFQDAEAIVGVLLALYCVACIPMTLIALLARQRYARIGKQIQSGLPCVPICIDAFGILFFVSVL